MPDQSGNLLTYREFFGKLAKGYDLMVPWPRRIRDEKPFFRNIFKTFGVESVFDAACGTGRHLMMFRDLKARRLAGIDGTPEMVRQAKKNLQGAGRVPVTRADLVRIPAHHKKSKYDAVVCLGDSLPFLLGDEELMAAFDNFSKLLKPGGVLILQNRNYDRVWARKHPYLPLSSGTKNRKEHLFFSFFEFHKELMTLNTAEISKNRGRWDYEILTVPIRPLVAAEIEFFLRETGFSTFRFLGGVDGNRFDRRKSEELVVIARTQKKNSLDLKVN